MSDEPTNPPSYPPPSQATLPYVIQEAGQASVIQTGNDVSHDLNRVSRNQDPLVSHDLAEPDRVIQNEANDQQKPCSTRRDTQVEPGRDTSKPIRRHYPISLRMQARKDWTHGGGTLTQIAHRYHVPKSTIDTWYRSDGWTKARNLWIKSQLADIEPAPQPVKLPPTPQESKVRKLDEQIEAIDLMLEKAKTPEDWQKLTNSKDKLLQNFYVLAGIAKPAARKAGRTSPARVQPIEPVEPGTP